MSKMSKAAARKRLDEARIKILKVMVAGHITAATATKLSSSILGAMDRIGRR